MGEPRVAAEAKKGGGFSLARLMRGRFCTQRGALLGRGENDGTHRARAFPRVFFSSSDNGYSLTVVTALQPSSDSMFRDARADRDGNGRAVARSPRAIVFAYLEAAGRAEKITSSSRGNVLNKK